VKPIFAKHCISCHGPEKQKGGLRLDRKADAFAGGDSGTAFAPGKPADSLLLKKVTSSRRRGADAAEGRAAHAEQFAISAGVDRAGREVARRRRQPSNTGRSARSGVLPYRKSKHENPKSEMKSTGSPLPG